MTAKQSIAWLQAAWKDDKKRINLLLVSGLAGMLLLCMSEWLPAGQSTQNAARWCSRFRHRRCAAWPCFARVGVMPGPSAASQNWSAP